MKMVEFKVAPSVLLVYDQQKESCPESRLASS